MSGPMTSAEDDYKAFAHRPQERMRISLNMLASAEASASWTPTDQIKEPPFASPAV